MLIPPRAGNSLSRCSSVRSALVITATARWSSQSPEQEDFSGLPFGCWVTWDKALRPRMPQHLRPQGGSNTVTSFANGSLEHLKNGGGREALLLKLSARSVKSVPFPVPFSNSRIWLVLFIHHFPCAIKPPRNLLEALVKRPTSSLSFARCRQLEGAADPGERLQRRAPPAPSQPSSCPVPLPPPVPCHFIKVASDGTAPHMLPNKSAHRRYPASLALSFQLNLELTLKVQPEYMWFKMTLLHLSLPS